MMNDLMTMAEIKAKFDSEWVLLDDPMTNQNLEVLSGRVVCHSKDRDEVHRKAVALKSKRIAIFYAGTMPPGTAIALNL